MKIFLAITSTVVFLIMGTFDASAQKITGIGTTPGYYGSSTPGYSNANRRYDSPREDYRRPSDRRYDRNEGYRDYRNDRYRRDSDCDDRGRYEHKKSNECHCDHCHNHDRCDDRSRGSYGYGDRDRYDDRWDNRSPRSRGRWGRD